MLVMFVLCRNITTRKSQGRHIEERTSIIMTIGKFPSVVGRGNLHLENMNTERKGKESSFLRTSNQILIM